MAHGLSCSVACGIFLDQELNPCPLHWQMDSYPLGHQGGLHLPFLHQGNKYEELNYHYFKLILFYSQRDSMSQRTEKRYTAKVLTLSAPFLSALFFSPQVITYLYEFLLYLFSFFIQIQVLTIYILTFSFLKQKPTYCFASCFFH